MIVHVNFHLIKLNPLKCYLNLPLPFEKICTTTCVLVTHDPHPSCTLNPAPGLERSLAGSKVWTKSFGEGVLISRGLGQDLVSSLINIIHTRIGGYLMGSIPYASRNLSWLNQTGIFWDEDNKLLMVTCHSSPIPGRVDLGRLEPSWTGPKLVWPKVETWSHHELKHAMHDPAWYETHMCHDSVHSIFKIERLMLSIWHLYLSGCLVDRPDHQRFVRVLILSLQLVPELLGGLPHHLRDPWPKPSDGGDGALVLGQWWHLTEGWSTRLSKW